MSFRLFVHNNVAVCGNVKANFALHQRSLATLGRESNIGACGLHKLGQSNLHRASLGTDVQGHNSPLAHIVAQEYQHIVVDVQGAVVAIHQRHRAPAILKHSLGCGQLLLLELVVAVELHHIAVVGVVGSGDTILVALIYAGHTGQG